MGVSIQQLLCLGAPGLSIETSLNSTSCFVYPNPFRTELTISNLKPGRYHCRLLYLSGQDVWSSSQTLSGDQLKLQFPALPNGYYILELSEKDVVYRKSIIRF
ncbi:MAG: T9SS type A sorting domain-containing protein [Bacteroidetes bacterium]|nr:T9SS type A sorting domain-containing protein [Bacteroidota bacterium]